MSSLTWAQAAARVAGPGVSGARQPDSLAAAKDSISETLQDWDSRRDWRFSQVVAPDISITSSTDSVDLPSTFKKPYVAYLTTTPGPLFYIERGNWHRMYPGSLSTRSVPRFYTLYNDGSTGKADLFPQSSISDTLVILYYRSMLYSGGDNEVIDILHRWEGYLLDGARARIALAKGSNKADKYFALYESGIQKAKADDLRIPDQFVSFQPPDQATQPYWLNPNSTWQATMGV